MIAMRAVLPYVIGGALATGLFGGWMARGWLEDSQDLAAAEAVDRATQAYRETEQQIAATLEEKLAEVQTNERVIEKWRTQIVDRPVYQLECIDADGLRIINGELPEARAAEPAD